MDETQWKVWEVFHQQARGEPHTHVGSVHAPDAEMALVMAKEQFGRRWACVHLWVVPADQIHGTEYEDSDMFIAATDKSYREAYGYDTTKRMRGLREQRSKECADEVVKRLAKDQGLTVEEYIAKGKEISDEIRRKERELGLPSIEGAPGASEA